ncbi:hypothetical protein F2P56_035387 [Juglans regia]|uniref:Uncharacterized protein LOC109015307 n=2 Tax=Juglans regia TaxID=51240 RepID=A0A2I4HAZ2_JUGRE|nr:uncharacterized protein LOC109015307 [Juglans regia]KAF5442763.1 hypothetical protein F2P56_035387 [Juglans regia]
MLNLEKTTIIFGKNTTKVTQKYIQSIVGMRSAMTYKRYIGLPSVVGRDRSKSFQEILDNIRLRISNHSVKMLTQAGMEIFIEAVVQAFPTNIMSVFKLLNSLLKSINSVIQNFWWWQQEKENKIHWVSWKLMGKAKSVGGIGFRDLECFNKSMFAKQCWRLIQEPDSLVANKLDILWKQAPVGGFVMGVMSIYGKWLGHSAPSKVFSPIKKLDCEATMANLIKPNSKQWKFDLVQEIFEQREANIILKTPINTMNSRDIIIL